MMSGEFDELQWLQAVNAAVSEGHNADNI